MATTVNQLQYNGQAVLDIQYSDETSTYRDVDLEKGSDLVWHILDLDISGDIFSDALAVGWTYGSYEGTPALIKNGEGMPYLNSRWTLDVGHVYGDVDLHVEYFISTQEYNDFFVIYVNGVEEFTASGSNPGTQIATITGLANVDTIIEFAYTKNASGDFGDDRVGIIAVGIY